jgi:hypothetical protein
MDEILAADKIRIILLFIVPGLIIVYIRNLFISNKLPKLSEAFVTYISLSFIYQAIILPFSPSALEGDIPTGWSLISWVALLFLGPAAVGFFLGYGARRGWFRAVLARFGVSLSHPVDCAWDWRFGDCQECWVLVVLKNGTTWAGYIGGGSFMSTDSTERDIYIEQVYSIGRRNIWTRKGSGVWIAHGEIQSIEFWPLKKGE